MSDRPTPETDDQPWINAINEDGYQVPCVDIEFARRLERERDEARDVLRIFADCRNWFHTAKEEGGPYTAWRGKREPDEIAEAALKEASK